MINIDKIRERVRELGDGLGRGIDPGISEAVVGCIANGLSTESSCEGHLDRGLAFPWVQIMAPEPDGLDADKSGVLRTQWRAANAKQAALADELLGEFYQNRELDVRLGREDYDKNGIFRIEPVPFPRGDITEAQLTSYRREMDAFAAFAVARATNK